MKTSEAINEISAALALAQKDYRPVVKNKVNPHFKNYYADLSSIIDATREALSKNGLTLPQSPLFHEGRLVVISRLLHKSGQWIETELSLKPQGDTPQALGSAITYGRRYSAEALLGVSAEDDDDGNEANNSQDDKKEIQQLKKTIAEQKTKIENLIASAEKKTPLPAIFEFENKEHWTRLEKQLLNMKISETDWGVVAEAMVGKEMVPRVIKEVCKEVLQGNEAKQEGQE